MKVFLFLIGLLFVHTASPASEAPNALAFYNTQSMQQVTLEDYQSNDEGMGHRQGAQSYSLNDQDDVSIWQQIIYLFLAMFYTLVSQLTDNN